MTETEYQQIVKDANEGKVLVGVDRTVARKLFTGIPIATIRDMTGETLYLEKILIHLVFLGGPLALLASFVLAVMAFHWWTLVVIPICTVSWVIYYSMSCRGGAGATLIH